MAESPYLDRVWGRKFSIRMSDFEARRCRRDWPWGLAKERARDFLLRLTYWGELGGCCNGVIEEGRGGVYGEEVGAFSWAFFLRVRCVFRVGRAPGSGVVAAGGVFDFDYFCSIEACMSSGAVF